MTRPLCLCLLLAIVGTLAGACGGDDSQSADRRAADERRELKKRLADAERRLDRSRGRRRKESRQEAGIEGARDFLASLQAEVGFTAGPPGAAEPHSSGSLTTGAAWSTIKVPIALRVIERAGGPTSLSSAQRSQIQNAITRSDNGAAAQLFASLGTTTAAAAEVERVLREAGDEDTRVSTQGRDGFSPYGQTDWTLEQQHRFMAALAAGCVGDGATSKYLLDLMGRVTSDTWGLGSAGAGARWKGGWGPGTDGRYLARQMGIVEVGGDQLIVTLAVIPNDGTFETGQRIATTVSQWLRDNAASLAGTAGGC